ncbi:thiol reductant ABC exporter subunit CydC [Leifsonia sp. F6_8S_P_1B]|uniref:Thiol reductant ABC exporter subunit CydC n=1 Tax=Leifsonia williamsii TaxID=3035919 RepID=A0ABT8KCP1_9MICO|nr:thiol reductant ABC exporter subunit CydC [Leifsonia williamsii]MDN4615219.1 thiol reductant ABC exporter subunit CydC [Leifsonia williamsii]
MSEHRAGSAAVSGSAAGRGSARLSADARGILRQALPPARRLWGAIALGALSALSAVALLGVSAWLITRAAEQPPIMYLTAAVVGVRAFALGRAFFRYLERLAGHDAAFRQLPGIRTALYTRLVPLAPDGLRGRAAGGVEVGAGRARGDGDLLSRLADDVDDLQNHALRVVQPLATSAVVVLVSVVAAFLVLPEAGAVLLLTLAGAAVVGTLINRWAAGSAERSIAPLRADLSARILDLVRSADVLTAFGALGSAQRGVTDASDRLTRAVRRRAAGLGLTAAAVSVLAGGATLLGLVAGIPALGDGRIDGPQLAVVALLPLAVFEVFGMVPTALGAWRQVRTSAERIAATAPAELPSGVPVDRSEALPLAADGVPEVRLEGVSAHWPDDEGVDVLRDVDLVLRPGERVLLTGPTGAGKTALAHLLVRFIDYDGRYTIGGVEARDARQDDVRRIVGLCEQQPFLFDADLRQNLLFARDTATDDELLAVLDRVGLGDWARSRVGLDTPLGERGALVSGGQAQRIALARALLADFPVLVVDEPTANVDPGAADLVVRDILRTAAEDGRTVLLISHTEVPRDLITRTAHLRAGTLTTAA